MAALQDADIYDLIGFAGAGLYLGAYLMMQLGLIRGQSYAFAGLNIVAPSLVLISLSQNPNPASVVIEVCWIAISVIGISRLLVIRHAVRFTDDEAGVVGALVPLLPKDRARKLLKLGRWVDRAEGVLAREGEPVEHLIWLARGACAVERRGRVIAELGPGALIGEITYLTGAPATATVRITAPCHFFCLEAEALRRFLARNDDIRHELERAVAAALRARLDTASGALASLSEGESATRAG